jgi:glycosyltransferase involved in cell wall biosynthesis
MTSIAVVAPFPPPFGGVGVHAVRLVEGLRAHGFTVSPWSVLGIAQGMATKATSHPFRALRTLAREGELVHYHTDEGNWKTALLLGRLWRWADTPYVLTVHSFRDRPFLHDATQRQRLADVYRNAQRVICISDQVQHDVQERLQCALSNAITIPSNLPVSAWERQQPLSARIPSTWTSAPVRILVNISRLVRYDGQDLYGLDTIADAWEIVRTSAPDASLLTVVGEVIDPTLQRDAGIMINDLHGSLVPVVEHAHIVVRATRTEGGPSLTVTEAMELGRWAVASDSVARPDGTMLFSTGDAHSLAQTLLDAIARVRAHSFPAPHSPYPDTLQRIIATYSR